EAYEMFTVLMEGMKGEVLHNLFRSTSNLEAYGAFLQNLPQFLIHADETGAQTTESTGAARPAGVRQNPPSPATRALEPNGNHEPSLDEVFAKQRAPVREPAKVGRNDPCPCGSGKKFKNCCGRTA